MRKPAFKRRKRSCCFCGGSNLSKEHIWPKWAAPLLPEGVEHVRSKLEGFNDPVVKDRWKRQGAPKTIRIHAVCESCNNGWMAGMEEVVRPWLQPILERRSVDLSTEAQSLLARYFVLKAMVADQSRVGENVFSKCEREAFFKDRSIPEGTLIAFYRYNYNPDPIIAQYNKEIAGVLLVEEDGEMERKGIANITFRFGDLFVQVLLTRQPETAIRGMPGYAFNIHPSANHLLRWPPPLRLDVSKANMLQHFLEATVRSRGLVK